MGIKDWFFERFFGELVQQRVSNALLLMEDKGFAPLNQAGIMLGIELPWADRLTMLDDILSQWRSNPLAFRIVQLMTDFCVGGGITLKSHDAAIQSFISAFCNHPQNHLQTRLPLWSDELQRAGELFLVLSRNPGDRMSYIRQVPARCIDEIETDAEDIERELRYHQLSEDPEGRWWLSPQHPGAEDASQVMLHFAVNKPIGAVRGLPDLWPLVPWLSRYSDWLLDRARLNKYRNTFIWHCTLTNPAPGALEQKRAQYKNAPTPGSILVTDSNEQWEALNPNIDADDAEADGKALRLAIAAGAGIGLHFLGEGESATKATAAEMGQPTYKRYKARQRFLLDAAAKVVEVALRRAMPIPAGALDIMAQAEDITREDNQSLAQAGREMVTALRDAVAEGWCDQETAASLLFQFVGEIKSAEDIAHIL